jgi:hypothetical protein
LIGEQRAGITGCAFRGIIVDPPQYLASFDAFFAFIGKPCVLESNA